LLQTFSFYADHKSVDAETWYHSPSSPFWRNNLHVSDAIRYVKSLWRMTRARSMLNCITCVSQCTGLHIA
jgi:hypothetical protein